MHMNTRRREYTDEHVRGAVEYVDGSGCGVNNKFDMDKLEA